MRMDCKLKRYHLTLEFFFPSRKTYSGLSSPIPFHLLLSFLVAVSFLQVHASPPIVFCDLPGCIFFLNDSQLTPLFPQTPCSATPALRTASIYNSHVSETSLRKPSQVQYPGCTLKTTETNTGSGTFMETVKHLCAAPSHPEEQGLEGHFVSHRTSAVLNSLPLSMLGCMSLSFMDSTHRQEAKSDFQGQAAPELGFPFLKSSPPLEHGSVFSISCNAAFI